MKKLEEIRARAEKAREGRRNFSGETEAESAMLALLAEQSSYDVPKLVAALEAVLGLANHEPRFTPMFGAGHTSRSVDADEIIEVIQEALQ